MPPVEARLPRARQLLTSKCTNAAETLFAQMCTDARHFERSNTLPTFLACCFPRFALKHGFMTSLVIS
jgi:hypothetical protein